MQSRKDLANAIRALSMDGVQKANSGHPGAPMGMADIAEVLWNDFLNHNPSNPDWFNRDRFVLSNGHGSMLIYSLLHLSGYDLSLDDLKQFRQLHSRTAGHPEYGYAPGIETTTGPLGQGIANAVGFAAAEKILAANFNKPNFDVVDHYTYCFLGDGCMMEGISHEVCSLAGTLKLGKLVAFYDDNGISIDGEVEGWFTDDTPARFRAYGWQVIENVDGHDPEAVAAAIKLAQGDSEKPTLICCKTVIGFGSPNKAGSHDCHGAPLGADEIKASKEALGWQYGDFEVPADIYSGWNALDAGAEKETAWNALFEAYAAEYPAEAAELKRRATGELPANWEQVSTEMLAKFAAEPNKVASRKASQNVLDVIGAELPELLGGSADLAPSNLTFHKSSKSITGDDAEGNYLHYGVREFGMSAIMNGLALHGGFIPYGATFLVFMEYARNALRMAALMKKRLVHVYTHDSIGLGEDGPTHQPVEQVANMRNTPNLDTWRPCDEFETGVAWKSGVEKTDGPTALVLSRQGLAPMARSAEQQADVAKGGYVLVDSDATPEIILIATGSEVELAVSAAATLTEQGKAVRVVSMPCTTVFDAQDAAYKESVLPAAVTKRVAVEALHVDFWWKYVGLGGKVIGMTTYGESAPAGDLFKHFNITAEAVVEAANSL
ncbi:transketolase [Neiella sp. HB171785]|uniref:Transketolase n=1 Tax=Neiella litorisoli TaxID=2771431 RepID=A0A8J6UHX9_9GAMM|nr:transketolase [Neiella litorisoli]MBD1387858.1 transketolase [Neiella litorisoli]